MRAFFDSTVGKKLVVAATGVLLFGFVVAHMLGNLTAYAGARAMNDYAAFLHTVAHGAGIWIARGALLVAVSAHVWGIWSLTVVNRRARPERYRLVRPRASTFASRSMRWSGAILVSFLVFHLLHLTTGTLHPHFIAGDAFHNVTTGLKVAPAALAYVLGNLALGAHLFHGASSMLQTLGLNHASYNRLRNTASGGLALLVVAGNLSFPIAVVTGMVG